MRNGLFKIAICLSTFLFVSPYKGYKTYDFDYIIEYKSLLDNKTVFYLTNSSDNEYYARLSGVSRDTINLRFFKYSTIKINKKIHKKEFYNSEVIALEKPKAHYKINAFLSKDDVFLKQSDTVINKKAYKRYLFESIHDLRIHYIIEPDTDFHKPIITIAKLYKRWEKDQNLPNGVFNEMFFLDEQNNIVEAHLKLVSFQPYKKSVRVKF